MDADSGGVRDAGVVVGGDYNDTAAVLGQQTARRDADAAQVVEAPLWFGKFSSMQLRKRYETHFLTSVSVSG